MPINLMRRCFRERRRVALVTLLVFAALKLAGLDGGVLPLPAGFAAVATGLAAGAVSVLAPSARSYMETLALASLGVGAVARALPGTAIDLAGHKGDGLVVFAVWVGFVILARGARRAILALPQPRLRGARFQARAGTEVDIFRLWYGLVPTPDMAGSYADPDVIEIETAGLWQDRIRLVTEGITGPRETLLHVLDVEAPFHVRLRTSQTDGQGVVEATGVSEVFLVELGSKRLVLFSHEFPALPLGRACLTWLDDSPGRLLDRRLATIEGRARAEDARLTTPPTGRPRPLGDLNADQPAPGLPDCSAPAAFGTQSGRG